MSFTIELIPDHPAVLITLFSNFDAETDTPEVARRFANLVESEGASIYLIGDFRSAINRADMDNITQGAYLGSQLPLFRHPQVREVLFIATTDIMKMVAAGLNSAPYGFIKARVFETVEDALDYIRTQMD